MRNVQKDKQTQELLRFYQNDIDPENSQDQYENNKKWDMLQSEKILFKVLVTI